MTESSSLLSEKYGIPYRLIYDHAEDLLLRFGNKALGDTCERVGRDPARKLSADDRLAGIIRQSPKYCIYPVYISLGYAAALRNITSDSSKAREISLKTGMLSHEQTELIIMLYHALAGSNEELLETAEVLKNELRGSVV
jgi:mannitol-1-phosphate/altronate dehydrogenase